MEYPVLQQPESSREMVDVFLGYDARGRIPEGAFQAMENLSSDRYPLLSPRQGRGMYAQPRDCRGLIARDSLCWVDGENFVMNGYSTDLGLTAEGPKRMVSMGAYVVIFPDKKYINTTDLTDFGSLEAVVTTRGTVRYSPCSLDGDLRIPAYVQGEAPEAPDNMALWLDTSASPKVLMQWSASSAMWVEAAQSFVKISAPGIGAAFRQYDGVMLAGMEEVLPELMGSTVIWDRGEDYLLVPGLLEGDLETALPLTVSRTLPEMDLIMECGNRLWGCRYGVNAQGTPVNEIYASKLGDFRNWNCYMGLATDSYAVSLGADGPFTGAVCHMGYPIFFRENCMHKIYGSYPANFMLQTTPCRGVQRGSEGSLALVGEMLFYKSTGGICAYDGALPVEVSRELGEARYTGAVGGAWGNKYYISMCDAGGEYQLFVYDSARKLWHREDALRVRSFCTCRDMLYFLDESGQIRTIAGGTEETVSWMAETGALGLDDPDSKYLSRLTIRLWLSREARVKVLVQYDDSPRWEQAAVLRGNCLGSFTLPLRVRRCDHLRLRLEGSGDARVFSLTKTLEWGSDVF